jgi:hemerythrin superfamily protein
MAKSRSSKKKGRRSGSTGRRSNSASARGSRSRASGSRASSSRASSARSARTRNGSGREDAISLLKADHREVEKWFAEFERTKSDERKAELAQSICQALTVHATIEEETFYPAFLEATDEKDIHHEAEIEHAGAKHLIAEIESAGPEDDHFEARVTVLQEMIRHHVEEEEKRGGMFSKAQSSSMDLEELGRELKERKLELMGESAEGSDEEGDAAVAQSRGRRGGRELRARST